MHYCLGLNKNVQKLMEVMVKYKLEKVNRQETKIIIAKTALGNETNTTLLQNMILSHTKLIQATKML